MQGPALEYASVAVCSYSDNMTNCITNYSQETSSQLDGVKPSGWEQFAYMEHEYMDYTRLMYDIDQVHVLKNDRYGVDSRKCIINFAGSDSIADLFTFVNNGNDETTYCGIDRVHSGISSKLLALTRNDQYVNVIKPVLETCSDVTCVGHSLGGSLCNLFIMCANQDPHLISSYGAESWDEYSSLIWKKK